MSIYEDRLVRQLHERYLEPDTESIGYPHTVRVEITQIWDIPVTAADEDAAYEKARAVVYNDKWPHNLDMTDERVEFISCAEGDE